MPDRFFLPDELPSHESAVRRMMADAAGRPYLALHSLIEAQAVPDGVVVFEGDDGGQIYLVVRASEVHCSEEELVDLLADIDAAEWADPSMARIYYERGAIGSGIAGGMGGGLVTADLWVHPQLSMSRASILEVIRGRRAQLDRETDRPEPG